MTKLELIAKLAAFDDNDNVVFFVEMSDADSLAHSGETEGCEFFVDSITLSEYGNIRLS